MFFSFIFRLGMVTIGSGVVAACGSPSASARRARDRPAAELLACWSGSVQHTEQNWLFASAEPPAPVLPVP